MCYALLRVRYKNDKATQIVECESPAHMEAKSKELQDRSEVAKVTSYLCHQELTRVETWERKAYVPPSVAANATETA